ncbi:LamG-like jellyroll fold domain-containing protein [Kitasatospora sp. NPDC056184]|uniref:LamG-like jellyroll fold domain-containing protein n=1 Tax=Kitasatospora sp. NPDC056184 TaxID=3345738 RepID=UPI0035DE2A0A
MLLICTILTVLAGADGAIAVTPPAATAVPDPGVLPAQAGSDAAGQPSEVPADRTGEAADGGRPGHESVAGELAPEPEPDPAPAAAAATAAPALPVPQTQVVPNPGIAAKPAEGFDPASSAEVVEKRAEQERTYRNTDGTFTTRYYPTPVNFRRADGTWAAIDSTLLPAGTATLGRAAPTQDGWTTASGEQLLTFAPTADRDPLVRLTLGEGLSVGYALQGAKAVQGTAQGSTISYPDALPGADVTFRAGSDSFKETLVLKNADAPAEWVFPLRLQGLTAGLDETGALLLKDARGTVQGRMPAGWMEDSNQAPDSGGQGVVSNGVTYELVPSGDGTALKVKLDQAWLRAPERVFPVVVDPSVSRVKAVESTYVLSPNNADFSSDTLLKAGTYNGGGNRAAAFLKFNGLENTLRNATVLNAKLALYNSWSYSCNARPVTVHPITSNWSQGSVRTWPGPSTGSALVSKSFAHGWHAEGSSNWSCAPDWESIDLGEEGKNLVNRWTHGWQANYGLAVKADDWDSYGWKKFASENDGPGTPSLDITWSKYGADYELFGWVQPVTANQEGIFRIRAWNRGQDTWTPASNYKMSYLLFDEWGNNITNYGTNIAWTPVSADIPTHAGNIFDAHIRNLPQGTYTIAWTMDDYGHSNFYADTGIPPLTIRFSSVNIPPVLTGMAPLSHSVVRHLQPTLTAEGNDPDRAPRAAVDYRFTLCKVVGQKNDVDCKQSAWQPANTFVVPEGWLAWNQQYAWYAEVGDGRDASPISQPAFFRTVVPQPTQYTTPADAGRDFNAAAGNYTTAATDATLPTVGPELSVTRSYNSLDPRTDGAFGAGWTSRWDMRIDVESSSWLSLPGNVLLTASNGSRARFAWDPVAKAYVSGGGLAAELRKLDAGGWTLTDRTGTVHTFDSAGRLVRTADAAGHAQEISYTDGRLARAKDVLSGRYLDFAWTGAHITSVTASGAGGSWTYAYTGDRLTKVCPPGVATTAATGCTQYDYADGSRYRSAVLDAGPVGYWRLGSADGATVPNEAQVADRAPARASDVTFDAPGAPGGSGDNAAAFPGRAGSFIELPKRTVSASTSRSVELWFRTASPGVILSYQNLELSQTPWLYTPALYVDANGKLRAEFWQGTGTTIASATPVNDNAWHHVVLSSAVTTQALFLDGRQVGTLAGTVDHLGEEFTYLGGGRATNWPDAPAQTAFTGQIDEVAVYDYPVTEQLAAAHAALRTPAAQLSKVTLPSGRTSAQVGYNAASERVATVTDGAGSVWKVSEPAYTGGSFLYSNAVKASNPAGYWRLGERDGAVAAGEVGTGTAGGYGSGVGLRAPGVFSPADDTAARFSGGAQSQVELPEGVLHGSKDLAVELWFSTQQPGVLVGDQSLTMDGAPGGGVTWAPLLYVGSDNRLYGHFYGGDGIVSAGAVTDGSWHHVVLSAEGRTHSLYLDGALVGTSSLGPVDHQANVHTYLGAGFAQGWPAAPAAVSRFTGSIDEAAVYQHPLSAADVLAHHRARSAQVTGQGIGYRGAVAADAPAGFWRLDESSGTRAASEVAAVKGDGSYGSGTQPGGPGVFGPGDGAAARFSGGAQSQVELPEGVLHGSKDLAVELWFSTRQPGVLVGDQSLTMDGAPGGGVTWAPLLYVGSDNRLYGHFYGGDGIVSAGAVTDGGWHHVVLSAEGKTHSLYLDGALVGASSLGPVDHQANVHTYLGAGFAQGWPAAPAAVSRFTGSIDEAAVYQHPLSAERVAAHYQARSLSAATTLASRVTVTDPAGGIATDVYDAQRGGRLIARTDTAGATTTYSYDTGGYLHTVVDANGHSTITGQDARGNTVSRTTCRDKDSCWTSYTGYYLNKDNDKDPRNDKPVEIRDARSTGPADNRYRTTIGYTALGLPEFTTLPDGRVSRTTYTTGTEPAAGGGLTPAGLVASEVSPSGATTAYAYRSNGDLASTTAPSGLRVAYTYDAMGRQNSETQYSDAQPDGTVTSFVHDSLSRVIAETGARTSDAVSGAGHALRVTRTFDEDGRPLAVTASDDLGNDQARSTSTAYDAAGRPLTTTDAEGGVTRYGYDALGRTTSVTDPLGQVTRTTYTARGQLATTVVEGWNGDGKGTRDLTVESRAYDPAGRLASVTDAMGATTAYTYFDDGLPATVTARSVTQADGTTRPVVLERNEYDGAGHLVKQVTGGGGRTTVHTVDAAGRTVATTADPGGLDRTVTFGYDAEDRMTSATARVSATENQLVTSTFDPAGRLVRSELASSAGGPAAVTTHSYDQRGLLLTTTSPNGNAPGGDPAAYTTTYRYDELGRLTTVQQPAVSAESGGQPAAVVRPTTVTGYNTFGDAVAGKDALGRTTTRVVDRLGRATETRLPAYTPPGGTTALNAVARTEYDALSRITASLDPAGRRTAFGYDRLGHQLQRTDPNSAGGLQPPVDDNPPIWKATWTPTGLQLSATDPTGARTEATYDELGRPLTSTVVERKPTLLNLTTRYTWNDAGDRTAVTTPSGSVTAATHNAAGQQVSSTDAMGRVSRTEYDALGRVTRTVAPLGESVAIGYDTIGDVVRSTELDPTGAVLRTRQSGYDLEGRLTSSTSPATGAVATLTYDAGGRLTKQVEPVAAGRTITTSYGYDAADQRTRYTDGNGGTTTYTFTPWGLPESAVEPATTAYPAAADRTWTTVYDVAGRAVKATEPGGIVRTRSYDPMGRLTGETGTGAEAATEARTFGYDKAGRMVLTNGNGISSQDYAYNDRGRLLEARVSGVDQSWAYDKDGRLTDRWDSKTGWASFGYKADGQLAWSADQMSAAQLWYGYDGDGRRSIEYYATKNAADPAAEFKATSGRYLGYDPLGRLSSDRVVQEGNGYPTITATGYEYDLDDRLTRRTESATTAAPAADHRYGYDQAGRLTSWTNGPSSTAYTWDAAGNRTGNGTATAVYDERNRLLSDGTSTYRYTARGTLAATTTAGTESTRAFDAFDRLVGDGPISYQYDGLDRVIRRGAAVFSYEGGTNSLISDGTWRYARDSAGELMTAADAAGARRVRTDRHTDVTATLDVTGTTLGATTAYDPFGKPLSRTGTGTSLGYQSGWTDPASGDVNMHARWYRPGTGGFASRDSWNLDTTGGSAQANRYGYANGDPLDGTDPTGHLCVTPAPGMSCLTVFPDISLGGVDRAITGGSKLVVKKGGGKALKYGGRLFGVLGTLVSIVADAQPLGDDSCTGRYGMSCADYFGKPITADRGEDRNERRCLRQWWRQECGGDGVPPTAKPVDAPAGGGGGGGGGGGRGGGGGTCTTCKKPGPVRPEPRPIPDRPTPLPDWKAPDFAQLLLNITAVYLADELSKLLALDPTHFAPADGTDNAPLAMTEPVPGGKNGGRTREDDKCDDGPGTSATGHAVFMPRQRYYDKFLMRDECRATRVFALLDKSDYCYKRRCDGVNTNSSTQPPGMSEIAAEGETPANGHLIPAAAKGSGIDLRNLVAIYQKTNTPYLSSGVERDIIQAIKKGKHVAVSVEPTYRNANTGVVESLEYNYVILEDKIVKHCVITQSPTGGTTRGTSNCPKL